MQKVALLAHRSLQESLLEFLQDEGVMEVSPNEETSDIDHPRVAYEEAEVQFAIDSLLPYASNERKKAMKDRVSVEEVRRSALHTDFRSIIDGCKKLEDAEGEIGAEKQRLQLEKEALEPWRGLPLKLDERETEKTVVVFSMESGMRNQESGLNLQEELEKKIPQCQLIRTDTASPRKAPAGPRGTAAIIWKEDREEFEKIAARHGWTEVQLPSVARTPAIEFNRMRQALRVIEGKEKELRAKRQTLAEALPGLARLALYLRWLDDKQAVRSELARTDQTLMLTGWIPTKEFEALGRKLERAFRSVALMKTEPREEEEPPVQIKNIAHFSPFESVTRLYGLPQHGEMDPTRALMPFFILFFGLCLTDAGYGLVLAALTGFAIWKWKLKREEQKLVWLLFYAGIVTTIVSIPFGGWFGMTPDQVPAFLTSANAAGELRFPGQTWDLTKDVDFFRNLALALGIIQILFGIFLAGYWKAIHGKWFEAIASHFSVHAFAAVLALKYLANVPHMDYALTAITLLFIIGRGKGPWFVRPIVGALVTVSFLINVMNNTLSYLRILALGLATGALAFAINQVAIVMKDLLPIFIGIPVFLAILLFGHMLSLALNGLGSFVHSGRLQFIEFFGQFFEGGGKEFSPFRRTIFPVT